MGGGNQVKPPGLPGLLQEFIAALAGSSFKGQLASLCKSGHIAVGDGAGNLPFLAEFRHECGILTGGSVLHSDAVFKVSGFHSEIVLGQP